MSFLDWMEKLPLGWEAKPLRSTVDYVVSNVDKVASEDEIPVRLCNYTDVYNNEFITLAVEFMEATATAEEIAKFGLRVDDVAITKDSESWDDIGVPALVRETASDLVCGYHLALLRPHQQQMDGAFLFRCLQAKPVRVQLELAANGVTRFGIPKSEIGAMTLPVPPLAQQRAIADYLDRETARLDALVAAKERVLGLLAEKRRALITRAGTRGLNPVTPLRDSGLIWLGEIPAHWEVWRSKRLFLLRNQRASLGVQQLTASQNYGVIPQSEFVEREGRRVVEVEKGIDILKQVEENDFVISMRSFQGGIELSRHAGSVSSAYVVLVPSSRVCVPFFAHLFKSTMYVQALRSTSSLVRDGQALRYENFTLVDLPLPPYKEQIQIANHLDAKIQQLDLLVAGTQRTIALIKERRAALIAAAVTGQIGIVEGIE